MKINIKNSIILLIPFIILLVFFLGLNNENKYNTKNLVGKKIDNFEIKNLINETTFSKNDFTKNKFTLINFWATWCPPCREEHKFLLLLKNEHDLKILGVNFKDEKDKAIKYLKRFGDPYHYLAEDKDGKSSINFGIYGIPESILVDNEFRIVMKFIGPIDEIDLKKILRKIQ